MLARGKNRLVGVFTYEPIFPFTETDFYYQFLVGIEHEATCCDNNILLFTRGRAAAARCVYDRGRNSLALADGSLLLGPHPVREELRRLHDEGYPFVFIGRREVPGCQIDWASSDYTRASADATRHLLEMGHQRLAFLYDNSQQESIVDRLAGCRKAVEACSHASLRMIFRDHLTSPEEVKRLVEQDGVTGILSTSPSRADAVWTLADQAGLSIPRDLSLVGLGDGEPVSHTQQQLTQVRLNRQQVGAAAMRALLKRLENPSLAPQQILVPCELLIGDTTSPPR
jgi:DNA-binding LacI/PurR family transcriptional regulator